jgi:hypothetical protein
VQTTGANRDTKELCLRQRNALGHQFYMILKFLKKSECYKYNYFVRWANSGGTDNSDWYKDNPGNRNLDKTKLKKQRPLLFKFLLNTEIKEAFYLDSINYKLR